MDDKGEDDHNRNIPIIEKLYEAFRHGDLPSIQSLLDENVDWLFVGPSEELPWAGPRHGRAATIESFFRIAAEKLEVLEFGSRELMEFDDKVLSLGHERMRVKATGKIFETDWIHLFTLANGKIVRLREFSDTAAMMVACRQ